MNDFLSKIRNFRRKIKNLKNCNEVVPLSEIELTFETQGTLN